MGWAIIRTYNQAGEEHGIYLKQFYTRRLATVRHPAAAPSLPSYTARKEEQT